MGGISPSGPEQGLIVGEQHADDHEASSPSRGRGCSGSELAPARETRLANFAEFPWAFVHPAMYGDGEPSRPDAARSGQRLRLVRHGLVDATLATVRHFQAVVAPGPWGRAELAHLERNADLFRARPPG
jgi:hypothetical protein